MGIKNWLQSIFAANQNKIDQDEFLRKENELEELNESLRKVQKRQRRNSQVLDVMRKEITNKLEVLQSNLSNDLPYDSINEFATSFGLYVQRHAYLDQSLQSIWGKFTAMLAELGIELILDYNSPYDDTRHEACDTRYDPNHPDGSILETVQPGIIVQGRLKRPAQVVVNKYPHMEQASDEQEHEHS